MKENERLSPWGPTNLIVYSERSVPAPSCPDHRDRDPQRRRRHLADVVREALPPPCAIWRGSAAGRGAVLGAPRNGAEFFSWQGAVLWLAGGFALLAVIDRFVYPVCPACSHSHQHEECATRLHGFATPLLVAAALHSALDGWSAVAGQSTGFGLGLLGGIAIHKIPEGLALGVIARASLGSRASALAWCALAESATLAGAGLESVLAPHMNSQGLHALLALAGGKLSCTWADMLCTANFPPQWSYPRNWCPR